MANLILMGVALINLYGTTTPLVKPVPKYTGTATIKVKDEGRHYQIILTDGQYFTLPKYIDGK